MNFNRIFQVKTYITTYIVTTLAVISFSQFVAHLFGQTIPNIIWTFFKDAGCYCITFDLTADMKQSYQRETNNLHRFDERAEFVAAMKRKDAVKDLLGLGDELREHRHWIKSGNALFLFATFLLF